VFADELLAKIEVGAGLVVGTVSPDGEPRATRAWAASVSDEEAQRLRVIVDADDPVSVANLAGGSIAVTAAEVRTFRSVQLKGRVVAVEAATDEDLARMELHSLAFLGAVEEVDGNPLEHLRRILPLEVLAVEMVVEEQFDQSPGPRAGAAIGR
jgi:hypothetical protein